MSVLATGRQEMAEVKIVAGEVNYRGDLNLAQLAYGAGVLDERYAEHLGHCSRALRGVKGEPSRKSRPVISTFPSSVN